jgi:hypothetical protein
MVNTNITVETESEVNIKTIVYTGYEFEVFGVLLVVDGRFKFVKRIEKHQPREIEA